MKIRRPDSGASLVELLTSMLLLSILSAISYSFARAAWMSARVQVTKSEAQEVTVLALDLLARDVRMAGFNAAATPITGIRAASRERVEVAADLNGDGDVADSNELIAYSFDAQRHQLLRATGGASPQPLVQHVTAARFTFFDADGTEIVPLASGLTEEQRHRIHRVDVELSVELPNPEPDATRPLSSTASIAVALRNP